MCRECSLHGDKFKWYLQQKNYILEEIVDSQEFQRRFDILDRFQCDRKKFYMDVFEETLEGFLNSPGMNTMDIAHLRDAIKQMFFKRFEYYHGAKVVPLQEAMDIVDIPERVYLLNCVCKQIYDGEERASCLCFNTLGDIMVQYPDYHVKKFEKNLITSEEAKALLQKEGAEGSINCIYYYIKPYIGALCSCRLPFCPNLKNRIWANVEGALEKSDYIAMVDTERCRSCSTRSCVSFCNFGALKLENDEIVFDGEHCFGCFSCMNGCEHSAINLTPR